MGKLTNILLTLLVVLAIGVALAVTYSAVAPFKPYELRSYSVDPNMQCMGDVVELYPTRILQPGNFDVHVDPYWRSQTNGEIIEAPISTSLDLEGTGKLDRDRSELAQEVPEKAGVWEHHVEVTIEGRVGLLPRKQVINDVADTPVKVLPNSDPRCDGGTIDGQRTR